MLRKLFRRLRKFFFKDKLTDVIAPLAVVLGDLQEHATHHVQHSEKKYRKARVLELTADKHVEEAGRARDISTKLGTFF